MGGFNDPYTELSNGYFSHNEEREKNSTKWNNLPSNIYHGTNQKRDDFALNSE